MLTQVTLTFIVDTKDPIEDLIRAHYSGIETEIGACGVISLLANKRIAISPTDPASVPKLTLRRI